MAKQFENSGLRILVGNAFNDGNPSTRTYELGLYISALAPTGSRAASEYTDIEADFTGYGRVDISPAGVATVEANEGKLVFDIAVFQITDAMNPNDIYGAFLLDKVSGDLVGVAEDDAAPQTLDTQGQTYGVTLTVKFARG